MTFPLLSTDTNYLEANAGAPVLTVATFPKSGSIILLRVCCYSTYLCLTYISFLEGKDNVIILLVTIFLCYVLIITTCYRFVSKYQNTVVSECMAVLCVGLTLKIGTNKVHYSEVNTLLYRYTLVGWYNHLQCVRCRSLKQWTRKLLSGAPTSKVDTIFFLLLTLQTLKI